MQVRCQMARKSNVIVGLGKTGLSYARFLAARGENFMVADDNPAEANVMAVRRISPDAIIGPISVGCLLQADEIFISPGVPLEHEAVSMAPQGQKSTGRYPALWRISRGAHYWNNRHEWQINGEQVRVRTDP